MRKTILTACSLLILTFAASTFAGGSSFWRDSAAGFTRGDIEDGVVLSTEGRLELARCLTTILQDPAISHVHCLAVDSKGVVYAGTGNQGKVYRMKQGKQEVFYDAGDPIVFSLALDGNDNLYVGTSPSGRVYKVDAKGKASVFFDSGQHYVWDLAFAPDGALYVATGSQGKLFCLDESGNAKLVYDARDPHIYCLAIDQTGVAYLGTSGSGMVVKLVGQQSTVLYDASESEIRALALDRKGNLYLGTADVGKQATPEQFAESAKGIISQLLQGEGGGTPGVLSPTSVTFRGEKIAAKNSLYRIDKTGNVLKLFSGAGLMILSAGRLGDEIYFGTGNRGRLFKIGAERKISQLPDLEVRQVLTMASSRSGKLYLGSAGEAKVFEVAPKYRQQGKFVSPVHDTGFVSRWGRLTWQAGPPEAGEIAVRTRSGNTAKPDETWSKWSKPITAATDGKVESPPARFIQYQAVLKPSSAGELSPSLAEVKIAYITANQPPRILGLSASRKAPQGAGPIAGPPRPTSAKQKLPPGAVRIRWKADDPNKDKLTYTLHFKGEGEKRWKLLEEDITAPEYVWRTEGVPDGVYYIKLVASDSLSNPSARALETTRTSDPFVVDNTPPVVENISFHPAEIKKLRVETTIRDQSSIISQASYSVDNQDWVSLLPEDEIFDGLREKVSFTLDELEQGEHTLVIKATDDADNTGAGKTVLTLPVGN